MKRQILSEIGMIFWWCLWVMDPSLTCNNHIAYWMNCCFCLLLVHWWMNFWTLIFYFKLNFWQFFQRWDFVTIQLTTMFLDACLIMGSVWRKSPDEMISLPPKDSLFPVQSHNKSEIISSWSFLSMEIENQIYFISLISWLLSINNHQVSGWNKYDDPVTSSQNVLIEL